jgi:hypothetical protein
MGYLPSFRPTEIFVTPRQEGVFGISQDSFLPFAQSSQVGLGDTSVVGGKNTTTIQPMGSGGINQNVITISNPVGTNPNDNNSGVNPPPPTTPPTNFCPTTYFPVCANGQTFPNACEAQNAGFTQYTQGECGTNSGGDNGNNGGGNNGNNGGGNQSVYDPETGCIIQGFDVMGNPIYIDQNGNPSLTAEGCQISPDFNSGGGGNNGNGGGGGGGTIPDDEKIIAFVKKNWMYLLVVTAGIYLLTNKSNKKVIKNQ